MPLLRVNATAQGPCLRGAGHLDDRLSAMLASLAPGAPVVVLVHGYKFSPSLSAFDPHDHILSLAPDRGGRRAMSWPRQLGFGCNRPDEGLCIAFGWEARGTIWRAWSGAEAAGQSLADLLTRIRRWHRGPVDMLGHSLGARVCLSAVAAAPAASVGRLVLLAAAEYRATARAAMASPAGRGAEVLNITTRENDLFDALVEWIVPAPRRGDRTLGAGLEAPNWLDLQIDAGATIAALTELGYPIPAPARRICHWSPYLRPGLLPFYRDLLRDRRALSLPRLQNALPRTAEPRWARLRPGVPALLRRFARAAPIRSEAQASCLPCPRPDPGHKPRTASPAA